MNTLLLIFFALPIATIILAGVLENLLNSPIQVALIFFAIYIVVTFAAFDVNFLVAAIIYTIIAFITAIVIRFIKNLINESNLSEETITSNMNSNTNNLNTNNNIQITNMCRRRR